MHRTLALLLLLALSLLPNATLSAQDSAAVAPLAPGQRARVFLRDVRHPVIGEFVSADSQAIVVRRSDEEMIWLGWANIVRLDASVGQHSSGRNFARGMAVGFLSGVVIGGIAILIAEAGEDECCGDPAGSAKVATYLGTPVMTLLGGMMGLAADRDKWQRVPLSGTPPRLTILPLPGGNVGLGAGLELGP